MRALKASCSEREWRYLPPAKAAKGLDDWAVADGGVRGFDVVPLAMLGPPVVAHVFLWAFQSAF